MTWSWFKSAFPIASNAFPLIHLLFPNLGLFIALRMFFYKHSCNIIIPLFKVPQQPPYSGFQDPTWCYPDVPDCLSPTGVVLYITWGGTEHQHSPAPVLSFPSQYLYSRSVLFLKYSQTQPIKTNFQDPNFKAKHKTNFKKPFLISLINWKCIWILTRTFSGLLRQQPCSIFWLTVWLFTSTVRLNFEQDSF